MNFMDQKKDIAEYLVTFVAEFAKRYNLTDVQAFRYLYNHKAIDLLSTHYGFAHTQSFETMISDISTYCKRMGGALG